MSRVNFLFFWLILASATCNYTNFLWKHRCDAGSEVFACAISGFLYIPLQNMSRVIEPNGTAMRRISMRMNIGIKRRNIPRYHILAYDAALHDELKRPRAVQVIESRLQLVEIPIDLEYGDFSDGYVRSVIVPPSEAAYSLRYLDLQYNRLTECHNLSALVNLETLILSRNRITRITKQMFQRMANLTTLTIPMNRIAVLSLSMLPPRLEKFFVHMNVLNSLDFSDAYLPTLEVLTVSYGFLVDLNVSAVLAAAPKLKEIKLLYNSFGLDKERNITAALKAAGVAHDEGLGEEQPDVYESYSDEEPEDDDDDDDDVNFYLDRKAQFWEHTFAWLLAIGNTIVLVWAAFHYYKGKQRFGIAP